MSGSGALTQSVANGLSGTAGLNVTGGTATLSLANNYSGPTSLSGGILIVSNPSGSGTGSSAVTLTGGVLASGAVGTIGGSVSAGAAAPTPSRQAASGPSAR